MAKGLEYVNVVDAGMHLDKMLVAYYVMTSYGTITELIHETYSFYNNEYVGILVVVIDVNPSHGFWTARFMKVFGHEGKCTCRYKTHGWIVYIMLFPAICGMSCGSSWLRRNEFLKMTK
jgi:hypothetical protein